MTTKIDGSGITYNDTTKQTTAIAQVAHVVHQSTDNGGAALAGNNRRILNVLKQNTIPGVSVNITDLYQVVLPAGTYRFTGWGLTYAVNNAITFVRNASTSEVLVRSAPSYSDGTAGAASCINPFDETVTLSAQTIVELVTYCTVGKAVNGLGVTGGTAGVANIYASLRIERIPA